MAGVLASIRVNHASGPDCTVSDLDSDECMMSHMADESKGLPLDLPQLASTCQLQQVA